MTEQTNYMHDRFKQKLYGKTYEPKKPYYIPKVSQKRAKELAEQKEIGTDSAMNVFFEKMRPKMTGICQCGCGRKSSKLENDHYRSSICHIFPKRIFKSIERHELNWVERNFWDGCHTNMDNQSMDKWVNMADWEDIKERFHSLVPILTDEERKTKLYTHLEQLIYNPIKK
jgi:hypothetical protein